MFRSSNQVFLNSYKSSVAVLSLPEQLVSATEQLRKCFGAVSKCSGAVSK